jgi:hypothetical protein
VLQRNILTVAKMSRFFSGGLTLGGPTQTKKTMGGGLDALLKKARCARLMLDA